MDEEIALLAVHTSLLKHSLQHSVLVVHLLQILFSLSENAAVVILVDIAKLQDMHGGGGVKAIEWNDGSPSQGQGGTL